LAFDRASLSVPLAAAINACGGDRDRSVKLGAGSGGDSDESLRITRTRVRRRTSRCSGRSRRREIGVTSTDRSCGARAAERQGVGRTWHLGVEEKFERRGLFGEGEPGLADPGVTFWSGRKKK